MVVLKVPLVLYYMVEWSSAVLSVGLVVDCRTALHERLGGQVNYTMFRTEIGDATVLHGEIALTLFARTR